MKTQELEIATNFIALILTIMAFSNYYQDMPTFYPLGLAAVLVMILGRFFAIGNSYFDEPPITIEDLKELEDLFKQEAV